MASIHRMNADDGSLIAVIADEDTVTGFLLAGVGHVDERQRSNYVIVSDKTSEGEIAEAFKDFTTREDIAVVLITQVVRRVGWEICVRARVFDGVVCARSSWARGKRRLTLELARRRRRSRTACGTCSTRTRRRFRACWRFRIRRTRMILQKIACCRACSIC